MSDSVSPSPGSPIMTDEAERRAMVEFDNCCEAHRTGTIRYGGWTFSAEVLTTLRAMLSRPVLPALTDHAAIDDLRARIEAADLPIWRDQLVTILRVMHEPPKPAVKEVEWDMWGIVHGAFVVSVMHTEEAARHLTEAWNSCPGHQGAYTVVRLTGKATVKA